MSAGSINLSFGSAASSFRDYQEIRDPEEIINKSGKNRTIDLSDLNLSKLPSSLKEMNHIEELMINGNELTELPDWIGNFKNLNTIDFSGNKISALPASLKELKNLRIVHADKNKISTLDHMVHLENLEFINISSNQLTSLEGISNIKALAHLDASYNLLSDLPSDMDSLKNLHSLDVSCNKFIYRPDALNKMPTCEVCIDELQPSYEEGDEKLSKGSDIAKKASIMQWLTEVS